MSNFLFTFICAWDLFSIYIFFFGLCLELIFFWVFGLISIFILTLFREFSFWIEISTHYFFILYVVGKASLFFFWEISKLQPMFSSLGNDKYLFGMLYINLLNLVWFWSRIWGFYKFRSFKSWGFWYLRLSRLILILYLKCFLFRFKGFFVFLLKAMIFGWLIICLD